MNEAVNARPYLRGSARDRKRRREFVREKFTVQGVLRCLFCAQILESNGNERAPLYVVRHPKCGHVGGRFVMANVAPACGMCSRNRVCCRKAV